MFVAPVFEVETDDASRDLAFSFSRIHFMATFGFRELLDASPLEFIVHVPKTILVIEDRTSNSNLPAVVVIVIR